jgi:glycerophosphoryl diester phosphodiesterase
MSAPAKLPRLLARAALLALSACFAVQTGVSDAAASTAVPLKAEWNIVDHIPLERIIIQGHRGVGFLAEENTVESFELAWRMGIYPESDLRMTKDGVIVPFHDNNFARVVKDASPELKKKGVKDLTYAELAQLDVGSWKGPEFAGRRVLPMARFFEMMQGRPERRLYMDIKAIEFPRLAEEIRRYGLEKQIVLASRKVAELRAWKALVPESETLLWMHGNEAELRKDLAAHRATHFAGITQIQIHVYYKDSKDSWAPPADETPADNPFRLRNAFLIEVGDELRRHGILYQAFPYTDDPAVYGKLLDLGVMSFATDHPDVALRSIKSYYEARKSSRE